MKNCITTIIIVFALIVQSFGQTTNPEKEAYLQKSKEQRNTGWVFLAIGTTMATVGAIGFGQGDLLSSSSNNMDSYGFLMVLGVVVDLASIPFFISAGYNARKAASISINNQKILIPQQNTISAKYQPALTLKINL